jgi:LytR cell envelope-related transcriptional attenuator
MLTSMNGGHLARRRRLAGIGVLALAGVAMVACGPDQPATVAPPTTTASTPASTPSPSCPPGAVVVNIEPPEKTMVRVNLINASGRAGLATEVGADLSFRGFQVLSTSGEYHGGALPSAVVLRYGPSTVGDAWLLAANFGDPVTAQFDPTRSGDTVDVLLGPGFQNLRTATEVNQAIAAAGLPTPPPGTCGIRN